MYIFPSKKSYLYFFLTNRVFTDPVRIACDRGRHDDIAILLAQCIEGHDLVLSMVSLVCDVIEGPS
jgi:hypothetical protein